MKDKIIFYRPIMYPLKMWHRPFILGTTVANREFLLLFGSESS